MVITRKIADYCVGRISPRCFSFLSVFDTSLHGHVTCAVTTRRGIDDRHVTTRRGIDDRNATTRRGIDDRNVTTRLGIGDRNATTRRLAACMVLIAPDGASHVSDMLRPHPASERLNARSAVSTIQAQRSVVTETTPHSIAITQNTEICKQ